MRGQTAGKAAAANLDRFLEQRCAPKLSGCQLEDLAGLLPDILLAAVKTVL